MNRWTHPAGYAALILLLSAGAAQGLSGSNTVYTDDIVDGQVTYADIRDNAMTGKKILNGSVTGADLAAGSVGLSRLGARWSDPVRVKLDGNLANAVFASCPSGRTAIGGSVVSPSSAVTIFFSRPYNDGWHAGFRSWESAESYGEVHALCVPK